MSAPAAPRVLFVVAAGPRAGFGHLVRCRSLARALGVPPLVIIRGTAATRMRAAAEGWHVVPPGAALAALAPALVVVDDPSPGAVRRTVRRVRRLGIPVATVHDLGIAASASDLVIDGSMAPARGVRGRAGTLHGPAYAILDPALRTTRRPAAPDRGTPRVLIALGGGRTARVAARLEQEIAARTDGVDIRVAAGFVAARRPRLSRGEWIEAPGGLAAELAQATVALVAGGVTLYEVCALGVPAVALPLNAAQYRTIRAIARRGAVVDGKARAAEKVAALLADAGARRRLSAAGRRLVDGRGALRVAARLRKLAAAGAGRHARVA